jgi:hypothetical protein
MGFDIFLHNFHNGEPALFPSSLVKQCFGHYLSGASSKDWSFEYPGYAEIYTDDGEQIDGFTVSRPPSHPQFWKSLFDLMKATSNCLYWPRRLRHNRSFVARASASRDDQGARRADAGHGAGANFGNNQEELNGVARLERFQPKWMPVRRRKRVKTKA